MTDTSSLRRRLESLDSHPEEPAGLITVFSHAENGGTVEAVAGHPEKVRINGTVRELTDNAREKLAGEL